MLPKALDKWLWPYLTRHRLPPPGRGGVLDVLLCLCDHFEPFHAADRPEALRRVREWAGRLPGISGAFRDSDGCSPAHTFFFPIEQYDPEIVAMLADICRGNHAEVEVHLHHDNDTMAGIRGKLTEGKDRLRRHDLLSHDAQGNVRFGFIHGNWALDHSHPSGRYCGVTHELDILREAGCYADFTMPSAPDPTQTRMVNSVYYAADSPAPKSHDHGTPMRAGTSRSGACGADASHARELLLIQGPLGLNWRRRKFGVLPRLENGEVSGGNPPTLGRLRLWIDLGVHVQGRPEWRIVKLHTHGGIPRNTEVLLGRAMEEFYGSLPDTHGRGCRLRYHFVTARELVNILHAAEDGHAGDPGAYRDYRYRRAW